MSSELVVFKAVLQPGEKPWHVKTIAVKTGLSEAVVSRAVTALSEKGLIFSTRKKFREVSISEAPHAQAFRALFLSRPYIDFRVLDYYNMRVLSGLVFGNASVARVKRLAFLPEVTVRRVIRVLLNKALVGRRGPAGYYIIIPEVEKAVSEYVSFAVRAAGKGASGLVVTRGFYGFVRANAVVPEFMKPTGLSVLNRFGVGVVQTDFRDYYYNILKKVKEPCVEEAVIHSLIMSNSSVRENSYALLALHKNFDKINVKKFLEIAGDLNAVQIARRAIEFVENSSKKAEGLEASELTASDFPSFSEFSEMVKRYE
jgi:DNA-binding MarR family transcriptional regulator